MRMPSNRGLSPLLILYYIFLIKMLSCIHTLVRPTKSHRCQVRRLPLPCGRGTTEWLLCEVLIKACMSSIVPWGGKIYSATWGPRLTIFHVRYCWYSLWVHTCQYIHTFLYVGHLPNCSVPCSICLLNPVHCLIRWIIFPAHIQSK